MSQQEQMEVIKAGAFSTYKQAGVPEPLWEQLLDKQALKWASALQAKDRRTKVAEAIRASPWLKSLQAK